MLSYPDSGELKKLGYPQELREGDWVYLSDGSGPVCVHTPGWYVDIPYIKVPTTPGMIEGFGLGLLLYHDPRLDEWFVGRQAKAPESSYEIDIEATGKTADQALCELWKKVKTVPLSE